MMKVNKPIMIKKSVETRNKNSIIRITEKVKSVLDKWHLKKYGYPTNRKLTLLTGISERDLRKHVDIINLLIEDKMSTPKGCVKIYKENLSKIEAIDAVFHFAQDHNWQFTEDKKILKLYNNIMHKYELKKVTQIDIETIDNTKRITVTQTISSDSFSRYTDTLENEIAMANVFAKTISSNIVNEPIPVYEKIK